MSHPRNLFFRSVRVRALMLVLVGAGATCPIAAQIPEYARINFQELTEGDSITDQYAAFGVYFSLADGPGAPIAVAGFAGGRFHRPGRGRHPDQGTDDLRRGRRGPRFD